MPALILYLCMSSVSIRARHTEDKFNSSSAKKVDMEIPSRAAGTNHSSEAPKTAEEHVEDSVYGDEGKGNKASA